MKSTLLNRIELETKIPEPPPPVYDVVQEAALHLGYGGGKERLSQNAQKPFDSHLRNILRRAGVKPFNSKDVEAYKAHQIALRQEGWGARVVRNSAKAMSVNALASAVTFGLMFASSVLATGFFIILFFNNLRFHSSFWSVVAYGVSGIIAAAAIFGIERAHKWLGQPERLWTKAYRWQLYPVKGYDKVVPEFALATALEILQHSQILDREQGTHFSAAERGLGLYVEELIEEITKPEPIVRKSDVQIRRLPEPFLVVSRAGLRADDEQFFVEVWDEPDFKAKRVV